jgi:hypothetical protein
MLPKRLSDLLSIVDSMRDGKVMMTSTTKNSGAGEALSPNVIGLVIKEFETLLLDCSGNRLWRMFGSQSERTQVKCSCNLLIAFAAESTLATQY